MTFRKTIDLIESMTDTVITHQVAEQIANGAHEGFKPYWKLLADQRILDDKDALAHIAAMVMDGHTSGIHPTWELKVVETEEAEEEIEEDMLFAPQGEPVPTNDDIEEIVDEAVDVVHAYTVVPVAETNGEGNGWFEVTSDEATCFVVEDEDGNVVDHYTTREEADAIAHNLNSEMSPSDMRHYAPDSSLTEVDEDPTDELSTLEYDDGVPTSFDKAKDFVVIINAIHERGPRQQEALRELDKRGLWLNDEQKRQAGL